MQCSDALSQPVQSPPQQSFRHVPATQRWPATQSVACVQLPPDATVPAGKHVGVAFAPLTPGKHDDVAPAHPEPVW